MGGSERGGRDGINDRGGILIAINYIIGFNYH